MPEQELNAEVIAIGTEILLGDLTDTNSVFIARTLRDLGINLFFMTSVGDNEKRIADAIRIALGRAQIVITCGGLGPTIDDMTRQAVAAATERGLSFHQELLDQIAERFKGFRAQMTENNRRQAYVPDDAVVIENPVGTAPSFAVEYGDQVVISLPGVPREMKYLLIEKIVPYLRARYGITGKIIKAKILKAAGIGESALDELIGKELLEASNPTVGLAAHSGQIDVRITAKAENSADADALIAAAEAEIRRRINPYIFGVDADTVEQALVAALREQNGTVVIGEIGVEPLVSRRLQAAPGGNEVISSVVSYPSPDALAQALGIDEPLPLRQLAERAAESLCNLHNAPTALVVLSNPAVMADQADSAEGSAIAVCVDGKLRSRGYGFGGGTDTAREWTGTWTMSMAWRMLRERIEAGQV
ncbi:MAG: CinA family nicotinamide mononucleotide deamidase-related protein [Anaerolineae bacterium]